jgi:Leucine-rich repeat (LRR) protein
MNTTSSVMLHTETAASPIEFFDPELCLCRQVMGANGDPVVYNGKFATIFCLENPENQRKWAVRCFFDRTDEIIYRYQAISQTIRNANLPCLVDINFQTAGALSHKKTYPIAKMPWLDGLTLDAYLEENLTNPATLTRLADHFAEVIKMLQSHHIAHANLTTDHIIVSAEGNIRLINYDTMYVPKLKGKNILQNGHPNYYLSDNTQEFHSRLDTFAGLVIEMGIRALAENPKLWHMRSEKNCVLLTKTDFDKKLNTPLGIQLLSMPGIKTLCSKLLAFLVQENSAPPTIDITGAMQQQILPWITEQIAQKEKEKALFSALAQEREKEIHYLRQLANNSFFDKRNWWLQLDGIWKKIFADHLSDISVTEVPSDPVLDKLFELESIDFHNQPIHHLQPLQPFTKLKKLICWGTHIDDLTAIKDLVNLEILDCSKNNIKDLSPLSALTGLKELYCSDNKIKDLTPLQSLPKLQNLYCSHNPIEDLSPVAALTDLSKLYCSNTFITDLTPLGALIQLTLIDCSKNAISDITPLQNLIHLRYLSCDSTLINDLTPLKELQSLQTLICSFTEITDITPLSNLQQLQKLYLHNTKITDLTPIFHLKKLQFVSCANTLIPPNELKKASMLLPSLSS